MRRVTLNTALVLSFFAFSMSAPAYSLPTSKERTAKVSTQESVQGAKQAAAKKQLATIKQQANKPAVAKVAVVKQTAAKQAAIKQAATKPAAKTAAKPVVRQTGTKPLAKRTVQKRHVANPAVQTEAVVQPQRRAVRTAVATQQAVYQNYSEVAERPVSLAAQSAYASAPKTGRRMPALFASSNIVDEARRWIGTNPTTRDSLWCARFMNFVLERAGYSGTGSDAAKSFASYGVRVPGPQIGAIAVMTRGRNGGHVGVVSGFDASGNPIVISGNHGKKVGEGVYPRSRIYAYVRPI